MLGQSVLIVIEGTYPPHTLVGAWQSGRALGRCGVDGLNGRRGDRWVDWRPVVMEGWLGGGCVCGWSPSVEVEGGCWAGCMHFPRLNTIIYMVLN